MTKTTNTAETIETADLATIVALDAVEAGNPDAYKLLVGVPCTVAINGDRYAATIVRVTPSLHTIETDHGTFRWNKRRGAYMKGRYFFLTIGIAVDKWDPSF